MTAIATMKVPLAQWDAEEQTFAFADTAVVIERDARTEQTEFYATDAEGSVVELSDAAFDVLVELLEHPGD